MKHTKKLILTLVLLTSVLLTACGAATDKVLEALERGNYAEADSIFYEKVAGDIEKEQRVLEGITTRFNAVVTEYNNGEKDYDTACKFVLAVAESELRDDLMAEDIATVYDLAQPVQYVLSLLNVSKQAYNEGLELLKVKDYIAAIDCFENVIDADTNYRDAQEQLLNAQNLYEADVLRRAKREYDASNDYEAAIRILQESGLTTEKIKEEIKKYKSYAPPANLSDLKPGLKYPGIHIGTESEGIYTDSNGDVYNEDNVIYIQTTKQSETANGFVLYNLKSEYSRLTGVVYRPYSSLSSSSDDWWKKEAEVRIYGDNNILFESEPITIDTYSTQTIDIDISGVKTLKICINGAWNSGSMIDTNYQPNICVGNLILYR